MTDTTAIYKNLTPEQLAVLAFNHLADNDGLERERILSAIPQRTYLTNDRAFTESYLTMTTAVGQLTVFYWQSKARLFEMLHNGIDQAYALAKHKAVVKAIQETLATLKVVDDDVIKAYFMSSELLDSDDYEIDQQTYKDYLNMLCTD